MRDISSSGTATVPLAQRVEEFIVSDTAAMDNVRAVLVTVDGITTLEHYRHGFDGDDHEHLWSITKSVVATLIGIAIGDGLIPSLDAPLRDLLPEYADVMTARAARVTLRQLMNMTGGFPEHLPDDIDRRVDAGELDPVAWALSKGQTGEQGDRFEYSNVGSHLVVAVLHSALQRQPAMKGSSILDYARTRLFDPLGIVTRPAAEADLNPGIDVRFSGPGFGWLRIHGLEHGAFGLRLTPHDLAKMGQLHLNGSWDGKQLLPDGWIAEVSSPSPRNSDYGLMWWRDFSGDWFAARGFQGQRVVVVPDRRAVIVIVSATRDARYLLGDEIDRLTDRILLPALE